MCGQEWWNNLRHSKTRQQQLAMLLTTRTAAEQCSEPRDFDPIYQISHQVYRIQQNRWNNAHLWSQFKMVSIKGAQLLSWRTSINDLSWTSQISVVLCWYWLVCASWCHYKHFVLRPNNCRNTGNIIAATVQPVQLQWFGHFPYIIGTTAIN